jgi:hypothetical protein
LDLVSEIRRPKSGVASELGSGLSQIRNNLEEILGRRHITFIYYTVSRHNDPTPAALYPRPYTNDPIVQNG